MECLSPGWWDGSEGKWEWEDLRGLVKKVSLERAEPWLAFSPS